MHGPISIRPLTYRDQEDVANLWQSLDTADRAGLTPADICQRVGSANHPGWAAVAMRRHSFVGRSYGAAYEVVVGFCVVEPQSRCVRITALFVHPEYRRRGAGRSLVGRAVAFAADVQPGESCRRVAALVPLGNLPACHALASYGFASRLVRSGPRVHEDLVSFLWRERAGATGHETGESGDDVRIMAEVPDRRSGEQPGAFSDVLRDGSDDDSGCEGR